MSLLAKRHPSKPKLSRFSTKLLAEWRRLDLPTADVIVVVAASGGADSSALLLALDELIKARRLALTLAVAHLDHGLRPESRADARWLKQLAKVLGHSFVSSRVDFTRRKTNLEQAAREARYHFLLRTAKRIKSTLVLTAHSLDDQAETILLRLLRGSAAEGLAGISAVRALQEGSTVKLARPLLEWARREEIEDYCRARDIQFRTDDMNNDENFARVKVRKQLLPLMKSFNSRIVETLSRTAALLGEDASTLSGQADALLKLASKTSLQNETESTLLDVSILQSAPAAIRRRALRQWVLGARGDLRRVERVHLLALEKLTEGNAGGRTAELPGGMRVTRRRGMLELSGKKRLKKNPSDSKIPKP